MSDFVATLKGAIVEVSSCADAAPFVAAGGSHHSDASILSAAVDSLYTLRRAQEALRSVGMYEAADDCRRGAAVVDWCLTESGCTVSARSA